MAPPDMAPQFLALVAKDLDRAYKIADELMPPQVAEELSQRLRQLWIVSDGERVLAAALTRIVKLRSGTAVRITACGGRECDRWAHLISTIEDFARFEGCRKVQIEGRNGWRRIFPHYRQVRIVLERELADGQRHQGNDDLSIE